MVLAEVVADRVEAVAEAEGGETGVAIADLEAESVDDLAFDGPEFPGHECDLSQSHACLRERAAGGAAPLGSGASSARRRM